MAWLCSHLAWAQTEHKGLQRMVVFPVQAPKEVLSSAEETWWQVREVLTENKRFLVASKNFLLQKDVYQSRGELSPADAIILGKLLDAQALITTYVQERKLFMKVYDGEFGRIIWQRDISLVSSLPMAQQLADAGKKLIKDFIATIPYQGVVVVDPLKGKATYKEQGVVYVKVDVGLNTSIEQADKVQFVRVYSDSLKPLFEQGASIEVFAEGSVVQVDKNTLLVAVDRATKVEDIREMTLVRVPKELKRVQEVFALQDKLRAQLDPAVLSPEMSPANEVVAEKKPLLTSLTFLLNLAAFLLLAF